MLVNFRRSTVWWNKLNFSFSTHFKGVSNKSNWFKDYLLGYYLLELLLWLTSFFKFLQPFVTKAYYRIQSAKVEAVDKSFKIFNFDCLFKQYVYEAAIPMLESLHKYSFTLKLAFFFFSDQTAYFLLKLKTWLENHPEVKVHFPVEVRFAKEDNIWLSPCYKQTSCYINIIMYK